MCSQGTPSNLLITMDDVKCLSRRIRAPLCALSSFRVLPILQFSPGSADRLAGIGGNSLIISIRKHIDNLQEDTCPPGTPEYVLSEFRRMLLAIGQCADRAVPSLGVALNQKMTGLQETLVHPVTTDTLARTNQQARSELSQWADRASSHHEDI